MNLTKSLDKVSPDYGWEVPEHFLVTRIEGSGNDVFYRIRLSQSTVLSEWVLNKRQTSLLFFGEHKFRTRVFLAQKKGRKLQTVHRQIQIVEGQTSEWGWHRRRWTHGVVRRIQSVFCFCDVWVHVSNTVTVVLYLVWRSQLRNGRAWHNSKIPTGEGNVDSRRCWRVDAISCQMQNVGCHTVTARFRVLGCTYTSLSCLSWWWSDFQRGDSGFVVSLLVALGIRCWSIGF